MVERETWTSYLQVFDDRKGRKLEIPSILSHWTVGHVDEQYGHLLTTDCGRGKGET